MDAEQMNDNGQFDADLELVSLLATEKEGVEKQRQHDEKENEFKAQQRYNDNQLVWDYMQEARGR